MSIILFYFYGFNNKPYYYTCLYIQLKCSVLVSLCDSIPSRTHQLNQLLVWLKTWHQTKSKFRKDKLLSFG